MNVRPGDLAYISDSRAGPDNGRFVVVNEFIGPVERSIDRGPHWLVTPQGGPLTGMRTPRAKLPDAVLRPIRPQPEDAADQFARIQESVLEVIASMQRLTA